MDNLNSTIVFVTRTVTDKKKVRMTCNLFPDGKRIELFALFTEGVSHEDFQILRDKGYLKNADGKEFFYKKADDFTFDGKLDKLHVLLVLDDDNELDASVYATQDKLMDGAYEALEHVYGTNAADFDAEDDDDMQVQEDFNDAWKKLEKSLAKAKKVFEDNCTQYVRFECVAP